MRTTLRPASAVNNIFLKLQRPSIPLRSMLIFSTEFVLGPVSTCYVSYHVPELQCLLRVKILTNCSYNRGTAIVLGRAELSIEAREPLDTSARGKVIKRASHIDE